jgi:hypothetical protein
LKEVVRRCPLKKVSHCVSKYTSVTAGKKLSDDGNKLAPAISSCSAVLFCPSRYLIYQQILISVTEIDIFTVAWPNIYIDYMLGLVKSGDK